ISLADLESTSIKHYELLGFKSENCRAYLKKRFNRYTNTEEVCEKIISKVESSLLFGGNRIIPFFVDVISNIYEASLEEEGDNFDFDINHTETPYPSLNEITDHIIYSVFEREKTRH